MNASRFFRFLVVCGILMGLWTLGTGATAAHDGTPLKSIKVQMGPYPVTVNYWSAPRGGQALIFTIVPDQQESGPTKYQIKAVPGTTVDAVPVNAKLEPDLGNPRGIQGTVNLPVSGQWLLNVDVDGPHGPSNADVPVLAGAPPAIPAWLGWLIGLLPVWGALGFILAQALRAGRFAPEVPAAA